MFLIGATSIHCANVGRNKPGQNEIIAAAEERMKIEEDQDAAPQDTPRPVAKNLTQDSPEFIISMVYYSEVYIERRQ